MKEDMIIYGWHFINDNLSDILAGKSLRILPKPPKGLWWNFSVDEYGEIYFILCKIERFNNKKNKRKKK